MATATLLVGDGNRVRREELRAIETPAPKGARHLPVPHIELVETLDGVLRENKLAILDEQLAVARPDRSRLFGVFTIGAAGRWNDTALADMRRDGHQFAIALRSGNDGHVAIQVAAGLHVMVCTNLQTAGDYIALSRKHTTALRLEAELRHGIDRYIEQQAALVEANDRARQAVLTDDEAKLEIFHVFEQRIVSPAYFPKVVEAFFNPPRGWTDCQGKTRLALHNAHTRAIRDMKTGAKFKTTQRLAYLLNGRE